MKQSDKAETKIEYFDLGKKISSGVTSSAQKAGQGAKTAAQKAGQGAMQKVLGPIWNVLKSIWAWFKYVLSVACCVCIASSCVSLGIPQTVYRLAVSGRRAAQSLD